MSVRITRRSFLQGTAAVAPGPGIIGTLAKHIHRHVTIAYLAWAAVEIVRMILGKRKPLAFQLFRVMWRNRLRRR